MGDERVWLPVVISGAKPYSKGMQVLYSLKVGTGSRVCSLSRAISHVVLVATAVGAGE